MKHFWTRWNRKQRLAKPARFYGDGGTIHSTSVVNVETDNAGNVVSVWFRCQPLPFDQRWVGPDRALEMVMMYECNIPAITGVEVLDKP